MNSAIPYTIFITSLTLKIMILELQFKIDENIIGIGFESAQTL